MQGLIILAALLLFITFMGAIIALDIPNSRTFYIVIYFVCLVSAIMLAVGVAKNVLKDGIERGRIEGAKYPKGLKIQTINYTIKNGVSVPKDTVFIYTPIEKVIE